MPPRAHAIVVGPARAGNIRCKPEVSLFPRFPCTTEAPVRRSLGLQGLDVEPELVFPLTLRACDVQ
jgi:hypothetical protein